MTLNLQKYGKELQEAFIKVFNSKTGDEWVILEYEGSSNVIKVGDEGDGGIDELSVSFSSGRLQYGAISFRLEPNSLPKNVLIHWQGEQVPSIQVASKAAHVQEIRQFLKTIHVVHYARNEIDVEPEVIRREVAKLPGVAASSKTKDYYVVPTPVGSVYTSIKPHVDINLKEREQFWQQMNREEKEEKQKEKNITPIIHVSNGSVKIQKEYPNLGKEAQLLINDDIPSKSNIINKQGLSAVVLWDYQAADDTEISFNSEETISEIEKVDENWWRVMNSTTKITSMSFNQGQDCFTFGCDQGVRVFNVQPLVLMRSLNRDLVGSVRLCTILHRSNLLVFVGAGNHSKFPSNVVFVWDDTRKELIQEITLQGGPIVNLLVEHTRLVVAQEKKIHIFNFPYPCKLIRTEDIRPNPNGLIAMSGDKDCQILVYPGFKTGSIQLINLKTLTDSSSLAPNTIDAHLTDIAQLTINIDGTLIATGSTKGTVIRVWNTRIHGILMECRRGADPSTLHCLRFSPCSSYLAVSSDKGTIHVFAIREESASSRSILQQVGLTKERRSCAQISVIPRVMACGFFKGAHSQQFLIALCIDGSYHRFFFDHDGKVHREGYDNIINLAEEQEFWSRSL